MKLKVTTILESSGYLKEEQYGFRESKSTTTVLKNLKETAREILSEFKYCALT